MKRIKEFVGGCWEDVRKRKEDEGLGFKKLEVHNYAMLAKKGVETSTIPRFFPYKVPQSLFSPY